MRWDIFEKGCRMQDTGCLVLKQVDTFKHSISNTQQGISKVEEE
jgi:hypothetical protein